MGSFSRSLVIEEIGYGWWRVYEPFEFHSDTGLVVPVEEGFECDLASIPVIAQSLVPKLGYWTQPAVVHDLLYNRHRTGLDTKVTRMAADLILAEGCKAKAHEYDVPDVDRRDWLILGSVVAGGGESWMTPAEKEAWKARNSTEVGILDG